MSYPSGEYTHGRPVNRVQILRPDIAGVQGRVSQIAQKITNADVRRRVISAMEGVNQFSKETAEHIVDGERGRILGLGRAYWPFFYGLPFFLLDKSHHHVKSIFEKGPSLDAHLGALEKRLQPRRSEAVDFAHIARGATEFIDVMKHDGLLRRFGRYHVRTEGEVRESYHADLSVSILEAQYDKPLDLARQLFQHSDTVLVGDVLHGRTELSDLVQVGGTVSLATSKDPRRTTGFQLELLGEAGSYKDQTQQYERRYYSYRIKTNPQVIGDGLATKNLNIGASQEGVCTVFVDRATAKESIQAWAFRPKDGAPSKDLQKVFAAEETLHDLYEHTENWDGNGALGILGELLPAATTRRDAVVNAIVATMVPNVREMSGRLPLTILARNKEQLIERAEQGQLRHIGKGKTYQTVDDFLAMIQNDLMILTSAGGAHIDEITTFDPPPLLDIIASRKHGIIPDILKMVGQTH